MAFALPVGFVVRSKPCLLGALLLLAACDGGAPSKIGGLGSSDSRKVELLQVHWGRLADVYGLRMVGNLQVPELVQADALLGMDIQDQRQANDDKAGSENLYDFFGSNPDTLQPRLLITRDLESAEFAAAFAALDDQLCLVDGGNRTCPLVPRNAALRLSFSADLQVGDDFFVQRDAQGQVTGVKNTQAVQLLEFANDATGSFRPIASRVVVRGNEMLLDPVFIGSEGLQYGSKNSAAGLPESINQLTANIRLALALEGPLHLPGLHKESRDNRTGINNDGFLSVVRDFRSGNQRDHSNLIASGFLRDGLPPRLLGRMQMYVEGVSSAASGFKQLTIFKNGIAHELDQGDVLVLYANPPDKPVASLEVLQDPVDDLGQPAVPRVRVLVREVLALDGADLLQSLDPSLLAGLPGPGPERDAFLVARAPLAVLQAEFTGDRPNPVTGELYWDDPHNFLSFSPAPLSGVGETRRTNANISPFAGVQLRFSKPINLGALKPLESMFFATRNLFDRTAISQFLAERDMDPSLVDSRSFHAKFATPHLIYSQVLDQDGSQSSLLLQPTQGFYLDEAMRQAAAAGDPLRYFLHLMAGPLGITDLAGNALDLQSKSGIQSLALDFTLDTGTLPGADTPRFADNLAVYVVRRFQDSDEDERPSLYLDAEVDAKAAAGSAAAQSVDDLFGPVRVTSGQGLRARETSRIRKVVDDRNQAPPPPQTSDLRWCITSSSLHFGGPISVRISTANGFGFPIQNPLNPFGCRLQTLWREIDLSLSRTDPQDFNLDVEQMYWCPFRDNPISFDEFDNVSLYLGHSEYRPELCVDPFNVPYMEFSGLKFKFQDNYVRNLDLLGIVESQAAAHPAFQDASLKISPNDVVHEPQGVNRFLPLPPFEDATSRGFRDPLFVWRDERSMDQGGMNGLNINQYGPTTYLRSPFAGGMGMPITGDPGKLVSNPGAWYPQRPGSLVSGAPEHITDGMVGSIALPLLADFMVLPDSPELPLGDPYLASGLNGWQISIGAGNPTPYFRAYSAGGLGNGDGVTVGPGDPGWTTAVGGRTLAGIKTLPGDNSVYWIMADFLKRQTVATNGFVDLFNPHRVPDTGTGDPRLGPYPAGNGLVPDFAVDIQPPFQQLPAGTSVVAEFRGAGPVDPEPWALLSQGNPPTADNFPLDPRKAGDAHIRRFDDRPTLDTGAERKTWTYLYNRNVTDYTSDIQQLTDHEFTNKFGGPSESFLPQDLRYVNWRFIMSNRVQGTAPVSPALQSFAVSYRMVRR